MHMRCECGEIVVDGADDLPHKAHFIPNQDWFRVFEAVDKVLYDVSAGAMSMSDAKMAVRRAHLVASRTMWQCGNCGRLLVSDCHRNVNAYAPTSESDSKEILKSHDLVAR